MKRGVRKHEAGIDGWYVYRGVRIVRDDSNRGYWGHWSATVGSVMQGTRQRLTTQTQATLLQQIDDFLGPEIPSEDAFMVALQPCGK